MRVLRKPSWTEELPPFCCIARTWGKLNTKVEKRSPQGALYMVKFEIWAGSAFPRVTQV